MQKSSSVRPVVSIQYRLLTDGQTDGHATTVYTALALRRAIIMYVLGNVCLQAQQTIAIRKRKLKKQFNVIRYSLSVLRKNLNRVARTFS